MIEYNLARLAQLKREVQLPKIEDRQSVYFAYLKAVRQMLSKLNAAVARELAAYLAQEQRQMGTDHATISLITIDSALSFSDVDPSDFDSLDALSRSLARIASAMVSRVLRTESKVHTEKFISSVKKTLGVDLTSVVRDEDLEAYLDAAATRNALLITDISTNVMTKIKNIMTNAVINGQTVKDTKKQISEAFSTTDSRAQLIARDQTAKLTSDLNRIRQQQAQIQAYVWRTSLDERVRPRHAKLEGIQYEWDEKTGAEQGLPPGQPIRCRCIAQGVVEVSK